MATPSASQTSDSPDETGNELRKSLRHVLVSLNRREPLDPTYKRLLLNSNITPRRPVIPKDKFYSRVRSNLRERVEEYQRTQLGKDPFDRVAQRQPLEDSACRSAFTLREAKEHEQQVLLDATLASWPQQRNLHHGMMDEMTRKRHFEGIAATLQARESRTSPSKHLHSHHNTNPHKRNKSPTPAEQTEKARQQAELERQRAQARAREAARRRREEEERAQRNEEVARNKQQRSMGTTSTSKGGNSGAEEKSALHKLYQPIFKKLWDMEFANLGFTNPFRIIIDRENCASMGAADYCDIIQKPVCYVVRNYELVLYYGVDGCIGLIVSFLLC